MMVKQEGSGGVGRGRDQEKVEGEVGSGGGGRGREREKLKGKWEVGGGGGEIFGLASSK